MKRGELERAAAAAALRALAEAPGRGSVLVFLPGGGEVSPALNLINLMLSVIRACSQRQWHVLARAGPFYERRQRAACLPVCTFRWKVTARLTVAVALAYLSALRFVPGGTERRSRSICVRHHGVVLRNSVQT